MHFFYSLGIGGKGVIPGRERDRYGLGFYYIDVINPKFQGLFRTTKLLRDEYGFEGSLQCRHNALAAPDAGYTSCQGGAQKEKITIGRGPIFGVPFIASRKSIGPSTILGLRLQMVF